MGEPAAVASLGYPISSILEKPSPPRRRRAVYLRRWGAWVCALRCICFVEASDVEHAHARVYVINSFGEESQHDFLCTFVYIFVSFPAQYSHRTPCDPNTETLWSPYYLPCPSICVLAACLPLTALRSSQSVADARGYAPCARRVYFMLSSVPILIPGDKTTLLAAVSRLLRLHLDKAAPVRLVKLGVGLAHVQARKAHARALDQ